MEESRIAVNKFEKSISNVEDPEIASLRSELYADGKFLVESEEDCNYVAHVGLYRESQYTAIGISLSRKQAIELANANYEERVTYENEGYRLFRSEQIDNAWVNIYVCVDPDGTLWQRAVVKRGGYGDFIIDDDVGTIESDLDSGVSESLHVKIHKYINGLNWK